MVLLWKETKSGSKVCCNKEVSPMTIEEMKKKKRELGYTNEQVAQLSGVPLGTVQKIFAGITSAPRYETLQALEAIFKPDCTGGFTTRYSADQNGSSSLHESAVPYRTKKQGEYTLEDYYALPDDQRAELIDGVLYDMTSPTYPHQIIQLEIGMQLSNYIDANHGSCMPFVAPADVQLDCDNRTMVQPDVFVICNRDKLSKSRSMGAPDFIVEILSPSTWKKDSYLKLHKYAAAGVREYWLVDPDKLKIMVYNLEQEDMAALYTFSDQVPVAIFDGGCKIDFARIYEKMRFFYE